MGQSGACSLAAIGTRKDLRRSHIDARPELGGGGRGDGGVTGASGASGTRPRMKPSRAAARGTTVTLPVRLVLGFVFFLLQQVRSSLARVYHVYFGSLLGQRERDVAICLVLASFPPPPTSEQLRGLLIQSRRAGFLSVRGLCSPSPASPVSPLLGVLV